MASLRTGTPIIGGYWFKPCCMAAVTPSTSLGSQSKSGKPWPRLTAFFSAARADMTLKMVVPTLGNLDCRFGVVNVFMGLFDQWLAICGCGLFLKLEVLGTELVHFV